MRSRFTVAAVSLVALGVALYADRHAGADEPAGEAPRPVQDPPAAAQRVNVSVHAAERVSPAPLPAEPHPPSAARARMAAQRGLFTRIENALAEHDFDRARDLLRRHETEFAGDDAWTDWREGFARIVDCLEYPGELSRAAGQRFVDVERGSTLRRRVRHACLGRQLSTSTPDEARR